MDPALIPVKNRRTGVISHMSREQFKKVEADPQWKGVFESMEVPEPPEVTALRESKEKSKGVEAKQRKTGKRKKVTK